MHRVSVIATLAVLLLLIVMLPAHLTVAQQTAAVDHFTIYISEAGENQTSGNLTVGPVTQGDTVIITFIWNDTANPWNSHQMEIDGYNLTTDVLSQQTPTSVIQFTANMVGSFNIQCIIPCLGMDNMQNGWLVVIPVGHSATSSSSTSLTSISGATSSATTTSAETASSTVSTVTTNSGGANSTVGTGTATTSNSVNTVTATSSGAASAVTTNSGSSTVTTASTSNSTTTSGIINTKLSVLSMNVNNSELLASVGLSDTNGTAIAGAKVQFSVPTDFGKMSIGSSTTNPNGTAYLAYKLPSQWGGLLYASYSGSKSYGASNVTGAVYQASVYIPSNPASGPTVPPYVSGQGNFIDFRLVGVPNIPNVIIMGIFLSVLISVYAVIVFSLVNVLGIRKRRSAKVDK